MVKEMGPVQSINFCERAPYDYVVTAGSHAHVYCGRTHQSKITFSKFNTARCKHLPIAHLTPQPLCMPSCFSYLA